MKRTRIITLALAAVLAISALAAASASAALPELVNKSGVLPVKKPFTSKGGAALLETVAGTKVECKTSTDKGSFKTTKELRVTVTFEGCTTSGIPCESGTTSGVVVTKELKGTLEYTNKTKKEVSELLAAVAGNVAEFKCATTAVVVKGKALAPVSPVNSLTKALTLTLKQAKGVQSPLEYESGTKKVKATLETSLGGGPFAQSGEATTDTLTPEEEVEVKA